MKFDNDIPHVVSPLLSGLYLVLPAEQATQSLPLKRHIYPVPDLRNPFLGVHFTVTTSGGVKIGPTAIPCLVCTLPCLVKLSSWVEETLHPPAPFPLELPQHKLPPSPFC